MSHLAKSARRALADFVLRNLLALRAAQGFLTTGQVQEAAVQVGASERTVWRWVESGRTPAPERPRYELDEHAIRVLYECRGNAALAAEVIARSNPNGPSARTVRRAFGQMDPRERAGARLGEKGVRQMQLYRHFDAEHRNEIWEADHKELSLEVLYRGAIVKPWATIFIDVRSRVVVGARLSPCEPDQNDVLATILDSIRMDEHGIGGVPLVMRWDNGAAFLGDDVSDLVRRLGCQAAPTDAYTPHQKGRVERFNRTLDQRFCSIQPGYVHGPALRNGVLYDEDAPKLTWEELLARFDEFIRSYNLERPHRSLHGRTPGAVFLDEETALRTLETSELVSVLPVDHRTVSRAGIRLNNHDYISAALAPLVGQRVEVRLWPYDDRRIEVCHDGRWVCSAVPQDDLSQEESDALFRERGRTASRIHARTRGAARVAEPSSGAVGEPAPPSVRPEDILRFIDGDDLLEAA